MNLVSIERGFITVVLDYADCYALAEALDAAVGTLASTSGERCRLYEAMSSAFLAAAVGHIHGTVMNEDSMSLGALRAQYATETGRES